MGVKKPSSIAPRRWEMLCNIEQMDGYQVVHMEGRTASEARKNYINGDFTFFDNYIKIRQVMPDFTTLTELPPDPMVARQHVRRTCTFVAMGIVALCACILMLGLFWGLVR